MNNSPSNSVNDRRLVRLSWLLSGFVGALALVVWAYSLRWHVIPTSVYVFFPLLGLIAFSIMWSHYMVGFVRTVTATPADFDRYFNWTGYLVLLCLVLHPGLLAYQRFRDGFGLPPHSELSYVAPAMSWIVVLGIVSLLIFLAYELRRWLRDKRWWCIIPRLGDAAMLAIFYHGLRLGTQTHVDWFRPIWWCYGVSLLGVLLYAYYGRIKKLLS